MVVAIRARVVGPRAAGAPKAIDEDGVHDGRTPPRGERLRAGEPQRAIGARDRSTVGEHELVLERARGRAELELEPAVAVVVTCVAHRAHDRAVAVVDTD